MKTAYIGIGSNMGDPRRNCLDAIERIRRFNESRVISVSGLFLTEPVGIREQEWFVNCAVALLTGLSAFDLLKKLVDVETEMGRIRIKKWGPRVIDLDILLFGQDVINDKLLFVPHPMMHTRRFVMEPMADLAPDLIHPVIGRTMIEVYHEIPLDDQAVNRLEGA